MTTNAPYFQLSEHEFTILEFCVEATANGKTTFTRDQITDEAIAAMRKLAAWDLFHFRLYRDTEQPDAPAFWVLGRKNCASEIPANFRAV